MSSNLRVQTELEGPWPLGQYRYESDVQFTTRQIIDDTSVFEPGGLIQLHNLLVSERGTLYSRPGIWKAYQGTNLDLASSTGIKILGRDSGFLANDLIVNIKSATANRVGFIKASDDTIVGYNDFGATAAFGAAIGYGGITYLFPSSTATPPTLGAGQKYNGAAWSAQNLPGSQVALVWRDRVFAWDGNYLWWSKATDPTTWAAPDGGFVRTDGSGGVVDLFLFQDVLYVIGTRKIWTLTFTTDPSVDGYLRLLIDKVAVTGAALVSGRIYLLCGDGLYQLSNGYLVPTLKNKIEIPPGFGVSFLYLMSVGEYLIIGALIELVAIGSTAFPGGTLAYIFNTRTGYISRITHHLQDFMAVSHGLSIDGTTLIIAGQDWTNYPTINYKFFKMRFTNELPLTMDTDMSGNVYCPNYKVTTRRLLLGNPFEYKLLRWVGLYLRANPAPADAPYTLTASKYNLDNDFVDESIASNSPNNPLTITGFDKTAITSQRLHSLVLTLDKPKTQIGGYTINQYGRVAVGTNPYTQIGPFYIQYSSEAGQVAQ